MRKKHKNICIEKSKKKSGLICDIAEVLIEIFELVIDFLDI